MLKSLALLQAAECGQEVEFYILQKQKLTSKQ